MLVAAFTMLLFTDVRHLCDPSLLGSLEMRFYWGRAVAEFVAVMSVTDMGSEM